jgi:hypothetical protein
MGVTRALPAGLLALCVAAPLPLRAQSIRATGISTMQYVRIRPVIEDSVAIGEVTGDGLLRTAPGGELVRCSDGDTWCRFLRSSGQVAITPLVQDISLSAWGLGRGIRLFARLRFRGSLGGNEELWPRADDPFDALVAYLEWERGRLRLRGGRQYLTSGLGYYNYDGVSARYRPRADLALEAFAGSSLVRGLNEPLTSDALAAIEPFAPDDRGLLFGGRATYRPSARLALSGLYQRELRSDRLALYSERAALDGTFRTGPLSLAGSLEANLPGRVINDARLRADLRIRPDFGAGLRARWYEPYFELWTIWGAFSPVGFGEAGGSVWWRPAGRPFEVTLDAAHRRYSDTGASDVFGLYESSGWNLSATGSVRGRQNWLVQASYHLDLGFGAARSEANVRVQRDLGDGNHLGVSGLAFERLYEFRVSEGTVFGLGIDGAWKLSARNRLGGSLSAYRHRVPEGVPSMNWGQTRGSIYVEWTLGPEPGLTSPVTRGGGER